MSHAMIDGPGVFLILLAVVVIPISIACFAFWIWMLVHAAGNKGLTDSERIGWILIVALVQFLGALVYFFVARPKSKYPLLLPTTKT